MTYGYGDERDDWRAPSRPPQDPSSWASAPGTPGPRHAPPEEYPDPRGQVYGQRARVEPPAYESVWDDEPPYPPSGPVTYGAGYPATAGYPAPPPFTPSAPPTTTHRPVPAFPGADPADPGYPTGGRAGSGYPPSSPAPAGYANPSGYAEPARYGEPAGYQAPERPDAGAYGTRGAYPPASRPAPDCYPASDHQGPSGYPSSGRPSSDGYPVSARPSPDTYPVSARPSADGYPVSGRQSPDGYPASGYQSPDGYPVPGRPSADGYPVSSRQSPDGYPVPSRSYPDDGPAPDAGYGPPGGYGGSGRSGATGYADSPGGYRGSTGHAETARRPVDPSGYPGDGYRDTPPGYPDPGATRGPAGYPAPRPDTRAHAAYPASAPPTTTRRYPEADPYGSPAAYPAQPDPGYGSGALYVPGGPPALPERGYAPRQPTTDIEPYRPPSAPEPTGVTGRIPAARRNRRTTWADQQPVLEAPPDGSPFPTRRRSARTIAIVIAVVMVLIGAISVAVFTLNQRRSGAPTTRPTVDDRSISSQKVDPKPLTTGEVFGKAKIVSSAQGGGTYQVVGTDAQKSCAGAVTDQISLLMTSLGCTQVVRATMFSPDHAYVITAGIFNLPDAAAASKAFTSIKTDIANGKGRFMGLATGGSADVITQAQAHLAWDARGHYLTYCVIVLANGQAIPASDTRTPLIVSDVLERYLGDTVIGARDRQTVVTSAPPTPKASHS